MEIVKADNLVKYYGSGDSLVKAVDHVGLSVRKGEFVAVVGTSGSGKTTLLNLLGGLDYADEGTVLVDGQDITRMKEEELTVFRRRNIGFVFQSYNLVTVLNVEKNITLPIRLDGNRVDEEYIGGITSALGISDKRKAFPNQLSGGQQQRVAIARAIAGKPSVILADEPTGNLDSRTSAEVMGLLKMTSTRFHQTVIMITHNESIAQLADRTIHMETAELWEGRQMFENSNKEAVREIARESMRAHRLRNLTAILGITLTTLLITMVCTVGISFYDTINRGTDITPGPLADGEIKAELEKYEEIRDMPQVEWAAYVIYCNIGSLHNREMSGIKTALLAPQREYYERNKVALLEGRLPEAADEIAVSDTMTERLGGKGNVGDTLVLHPVIWEDGQQVEKEIPVTITGIVTSPIKGLAHTYEEIYTSEAFPEKYAPQMLQEPAGIYVKFIPGEIKDTIPGELYDIAGEVGAAGVQYRMDNGFTVLYLLVVLVFVLMIMFCGYLLIYNIFYISVVNDIRFFGMLKTIGTTGRQIRALLNWQVARLTCVGITVGLILGYLVGLFIAPVVMAETNYKDFYRSSANPMFFISAVIFSLLTVYISARKAYRLAMRISPTEAARYREKRAGRKKLWAGVSFALSGIIFLVAFTLPMGYNVENMVKRYHTADVRIRQDAMIWGSDEPYQPVSHDMLAQLAELPFIKDIVLYYQARDWEVNEFGGCDAGYGQMKMTEEFREEFIRCEKLGTGWMSERENGDIRLSIRGFPADKLHLEEENIHVIEGSLDEEKFADGGYVIYNQGTNQSNSEAGLIHAGQVLHFSIYDPDRGQYVDKEAEVLAVVERSNPFPTGLLASAALAFPDKVFQEIYSGYQNMVGIVQADAIKELTEEEYAQVEKAVQDSFNYQLSIESKVMRREAERSEKSSMIVIGLFLSGVFGMIGICNVVNTLVTSVLSRKIEFAAMQSVGMTKKQMRAMLCREGLLLSGLSVLAAIPLGAFFCYMLGKAILFVSGFSVKIFAAGCVLLLVVMCLVSVLVAGLLTRFLTRKPVVERLREVE